MMCPNECGQLQPAVPDDGWLYCDDCGYYASREDR
jgi:hypothetical protein